MSVSADKLPGGAPHAIGATFFRLLAEAGALTGARVLDNPVRASDLQDGERVIFIEDQADKLGGDPAQRQYRAYSFSVGVINRSTDPRLAAHRDYRAAKRILRSTGMHALTAAGVEVAKSGLTEGEVRYRLENIDVGGSLVLGLFTLEYRDPN
jgi:hypothetical protein